MTTYVTDEFSSLIDGPFYEHSPRAVAAILPHLPTPAEMHAEFRAHLASAVDGVEVVRMLGGRHAVIETAPGVHDLFRRTRIFGRAVFSGEAIASGGERCARSIRSAALELARKYAARVAEQVATFRAGRAGSQAGKLEPVVVRHLSAHIPSLMHRYGDPDAVRICVDHDRDVFLAVYAAYYAITPAGEEVIETPWVKAP